MRTCGDCKACCTTLHVQELNKPMHTPCKDLCDKGCGVYETRAEICRTYKCLWLMEDKRFHMSDAERPDKCGIIVSVSNNLLGPAILCNEIEQGSAEKYWGLKIRNRFVKMNQLVIVSFDGDKFIVYGKPPVLAAMEGRLEREKYEKERKKALAVISEKTHD